MFQVRTVSFHKDEKVSKPFNEVLAIGYLNTEPITHTLQLADKTIEACENTKLFIRLPQKQTHPMMAYGKEASLLSKYGTKGSKIFVRGAWMDGRIIVKEVELLETKDQTLARKEKNKKLAEAKQKIK